MKLLWVAQPWFSFPSPEDLDSTTKTAPTDSPSARIELQQRGLPLLRHLSHSSGQIRVGEQFPEPVCTTVSRPRSGGLSTRAHCFCSLSSFWPLNSGPNTNIPGLTVSRQKHHDKLQLHTIGDTQAGGQNNWHQATHIRHLGVFQRIRRI